MNTKRKTILLMFAMACFLAVILVGGFGCHPDPVFNMGNNFSQTINVYFNGDKVGTIPSAETKKLWPNEHFGSGELLIELKSTSGQLLYSKSYTWDDLIKILEPVHGNPYWIGPETQ